MPSSPRSPWRSQLAALRSLRTTTWRSRTPNQLPPRPARACCSMEASAGARGRWSNGSRDRQRGVPPSLMVPPVLGRDAQAAPRGHEQPGCHQQSRPAGQGNAPWSIGMHAPPCSPMEPPGRSAQRSDDMHQPAGGTAWPEPLLHGWRAGPCNRPSVAHALTSC